jgi:ATP-dependent DNA ligase
MGHSSAAKWNAPGFIEPRIPTRAPTLPVGPEWIREIKHDGYRLIARAIGLPLFTGRGYDRTDRHPLIRKALANLQPERPGPRR